MGAQSNIEIPTLEQCRLMWDEVDFKPLSVLYPRAKEFVDALSVVYPNGRVLHATFQLPDNRVFDWYASRNRYHDMGFFERFWLSPSVMNVVPQKLLDLNFYSQSVFAWSSSFLLAGSLAWSLAAGGPYKKHPGGSLDAKRIADGAAEELLCADYDSTLLFEARSVWSDFFLDVAWDSTWLLIHPKLKLVHVIMATDTD